MAPLNWLEPRASPQVGQVAQLGRDGAAQPVGVQVEPSAGWSGCPAPAGWRRSTGWSQVEQLQVGQVAQLGRDGAAQLVGVQVEPSRLVKLPSSGGMAPLNWLELSRGHVQVGQVAQLRRDGAAELVAPGRGPSGWPGCPARAGWPAQLVGAQVERPQVGQVAQLRRDGAAQLVGIRGSSPNSPGCPVQAGCRLSIGWELRLRAVNIGQVAQLGWNAPARQSVGAQIEGLSNWSGCPARMECCPSIGVGGPD